MPPAGSIAPDVPYPRPVTSARPVGVHRCCTTIRPSVSVPVLSDAITVTDPSVSTAGNQRTTADRFAIR